MATKQQSSSGDILHFGAVRLRVTGSGNLDLSLRSLDDTNVSVLASQTMRTTTNKELVSLANYSDQRGQVKVSTNSIGEVFNISKIVVFVKSVASGYPQ